MGKRDVASTIAIVGAISAVVIRAVVAPASPAVWRADESKRRSLFEKVASAEGDMRAASADQFPGDQWSADDDFHSAELRRARSLAGLHGVDVPDVLRAIDDGLRGRWWHGEPLPLATVPPCHPRPAY